jgi:predicted ATP-grasp superfamily ATP-dependent carboligase
LLEIADEIGCPGKIALFPTSDRIARAIGEGWERIAERYMLSWSHCRDHVLRLQRKDSLADACEATGVPYPRSSILRSAAEAVPNVYGLKFPLVVKPAQPLSSFKALKVAHVAELVDLAERYGADLPFVVQEWIDGEEGSLYACTTYLDHGRPLFLFPSRKLAAYPPGVGQGTVFESLRDPEICAIAERFLRRFDLSGPVAVEFKRDPQGKFWFIEPNVGRTEYCVDLAIQCGWDLPWIEYLHVTGRLGEYEPPALIRDRVWYDTDKDPLCFLRHAGAVFRACPALRPPVFPFFGHADWRPYFIALLRRSQRIARGIVRRATRRAAPA